MSADVHEGTDGWLFLASPVAGLYGREAAGLPDAKLDDWVKLIEARAGRLEKMGIQYVHMPAPEKLSIYDNKLSMPIADATLSPARRLGERLSRSRHAHVWLDIVQPLRAERDQRALFPKTDSHWNADGAFIAYQHLCARTCLVPDPDLLSRKYTDYHAVFDLGAKMTPPVGEWFKLYDFTKNSRRVYANAMARYLESLTGIPVFFGGSHVGFQNAAPGATKKVLVFGDSFCAQGMSSLTGMLAETASKVEFVWSPDLDWRYIGCARPDVVIYEMAERNMAYVPKDDFSLRALFWKRGLKLKWLQLKARWRQPA